MPLTETTLHLPYGVTTFAITVIETEHPKAAVFFAAGRGGSPLRHLGLLRAVARQGCTVIAPDFDLLPLTTPTLEELDTRIRQMEVCLQQFSPLNLPIMGIGHSLGCVVLLVMTGAKAYTFFGDKVIANTKWNFDKLILLAPAVDFFRHPEASVDVAARIHLRAGKKDAVVSPEGILAFKEKMTDQSKVEFHLDEYAGHFSYMDELPPNVEDCQPDREIFLSILAEEVGGFFGLDAKTE